MKATFTFVDRDAKNNIVYIEDLSNRTGSMTITNDAENVVRHCREVYGSLIRIVYKDTNQEWWEIDWDHKWSQGYGIKFKRWNGLAWDILKR